jgi:hypothetical protein
LNCGSIGKLNQVAVDWVRDQQSRLSRRAKPMTPIVANAVSATPRVATHNAASGRSTGTRTFCARAKKLARAAECLIYSLTPDGARPGFRRQNEPKSLKLWGFRGIWGQKAWKGAFTATGFLL